MERRGFIRVIGGGVIGLAREAALYHSRGKLKRLLTFARYGARIDKDMGRALEALRVLKRRADADLTELPKFTPEPERDAAPRPSVARLQDFAPHLPSRRRLHR